MPHPITLNSPLPAADLRFESMSASSGLSMLGDMQLGLLSEKADLKPDDLLGKPLTVSVTLRDDTKRHFHGYVTRFGLGAHRGRYFGYHATVRPWLWFLSRTSDCRIFQEQSVPDIVKKVFEDHGIADFEFKLFRSYRKWTYCVQYRESDFNFVARLLEHEGIYWYFKHGDSSHKLVLVDSQSAHDAGSGYESLPYFENGDSAPPDVDYVSAWTFARAIKTGKVATTSYDFERPSTSLASEQSRQRSHELSDYEHFDFQGDYTQSGDGSHWSENRMDELQARFEHLRGASAAHGICTGHLLKLTRHPREDQNVEYLITGETVHAHQATGESGGGGHGFSCDFAAIPSAQQYRPPRRTLKPFVQGPQTAVVVGPSGDEIYTDKYGRVKVQFHWDRYGQKNEKSSCWIRVSHPWAGKGWGGVSIPRIGQEVVVDFLEGDPDQPLITGRVYNAEQMPPFELPAGAVVSGVKSKTHRGAGYNELSMDDTAGKEKITIHGQYDMGTTVLHDQTSTINNNRTDKVGVDDSETVGSNQKLSVGSNRTKTIGGSETVHVSGHRSETVDSGEDVTVTGGRTHTVNGAQTTTISTLKTESIGAAYLLTVGAAMNQAVGAALIQEVGAAKMVTVGAISSEDVGINKSVSAGANISYSAGASISNSASADFANTAGGAFSAKSGGTMSFAAGADFSVNGSAKVGVVAASELSLKCGGAEIVLKSSGEISIKGTDITIKGSGSIKGTAGGSMDLKGSTINQN
jgi:type VI secretion system secreted protein VgrG